MRTIKILSLCFLVMGMTGLAAWLAGTRTARAHCDTLDGPVVIEAKAALEKGDVTPVLKWVRPDRENEIRALFRKAVALRSKGEDIRELADMYFFETLVRIHRAGEGAPYTGLQPAGSTDPAVAAADKTIAEGSVEELARKIGAAAEAGIHKRFARVMETQKHARESIEAGREYVEAYVEFVHYVEALHHLIAGHGIAHGAAHAPAEAAAGHAH